MRIALAALLTIAPITAAAAQSESVTVNSMGVVSDPGNGRVLIDPGTGQPRALPPLMQPWQFHQEPVKLHPPRKRTHQSETAAPATDTLAAAPEAPKPRKHKAAAPAETAAAPTENYATAAPPPKPHKQAAATPAPVTEPAPKPRRTASAAPAPQPPAPQPAPASGNLSGFADLETITGNTAPKAAPAPVKPVTPAPKQVAAAPSKPVAAPPKQVTPTFEAPRPAPVPQAAKPAPKTASIEPPKPSKPRIAAGNRRDSITFSPNATDPSSSALGSVRNLAGSLINQLGDTTRIQLMAYAGQKGEKTSDTRRLSLKRALVVRQLLIDDGIPAERIDVFALGGVDDDGPLDRVDVMVKG